jgi:hypothetical protein
MVIIEDRWFNGDADPFCDRSQILS